MEVVLEVVVVGFAGVAQDYRSALRVKVFFVYNIYFIGIHRPGGLPWWSTRKRDCRFISCSLVSSCEVKRGWDYLHNTYGVDRVIFNLKPISHR